MTYYPRELSKVQEEKLFLLFLRASKGIKERILWHREFSKTSNKYKIIVVASTLPCLGELMLLLLHSVPVVLCSLSNL